MTEETYLGDGLYVSWDGWQYCLRAPRETGDHVVYLEPSVLQAFDAFRLAVEQRVAALRREIEQKGASQGAK